MKVYYVNLNNLSDTQIIAALKSAEAYRRERFFSVVDEGTRRENIGSDILIKRAVSNFFGVLGDMVKTDYDDNGKPILKHPMGYISLSHTCGYCFLAVSENPVGIDAECQRKLEYQKLAKRFFSQDAFSRVSNATYEKRAFFEEWTALEAYFKLCGGIALDTHTDIPKHLIKSFEMNGITISIASREAMSFDYSRDFFEIEV